MSKEKSKPVVEAVEMEPERDVFYVHNADPGKKYYHAADDTLRIQRLQQLGYKVTTDKTTGPMGPLVLRDAADSTPANVAGHILMETSQENWERLDRMKDARLKQHERDVKDKVDAVKALMERSGLGKARARLSDDEIKF